MTILLPTVLAIACLYLVYRNWPVKSDECVHKWSKWIDHDVSVDNVSNSKQKKRICTICGLVQYKGIGI